MHSASTFREYMQTAVGTETAVRLAKQLRAEHEGRLVPEGNANNLQPSRRTRRMLSRQERDTIVRLWIGHRTKKHISLAVGRSVSTVGKVIAEYRGAVALGRES